MTPLDTTVQDSNMAKSTDRLEEVTNKYNLILEHTDAAFTFLTTDFVIQWSTLPQYTCHALGKQFTPGQTCYKLVRGLSEPCPECAIKATIDTYKPHTTIEQLQDGTTFEASTFPVFNSDSSLQGVLVRIKDISDKSRKEEQLKEYQIKSKLIFNIGEISTWEYQVSTKTFYSDNDKDSVIYPSMRDTDLYSLIHPSNIETLRTCIDNLCNSIHEKFNLTFQILVNNKYCWRRVIGIVYKRNSQGEPISLIGLKINIEKEVRLREQAEKGERLKTAFIANISHEIRTPLNGIIGFSELLMQSNSDEQRKKYMQIIHKNNKQLLQLTNDILQLSDIESGEMKVKIRSTNINDLILRWERMLINEIQIQEKELATEINKGLSRCIINTDKVFLGRIMEDLISNAVKFTDNGKISIGYTLHENGKYIRFYIKDTGKGIPKDQQGVIFHRFHKLDSYIKGNGLGLPICESMIRTLGGNIGVISEEGVGSEFWFTVPTKAVPT